MTEFNPLRKFEENNLYKKGDVFFLFGELFGRGYANGLVEQAKARGMQVYGITMGRREKDGTLRSLNSDELQAAEELLGGNIINVPMEAGFDMQSADGLSSVVERMQSLTPNNWKDFDIPDGELETLRLSGEQRFRANLKTVLSELSKKIQPGNNLHVAHIMAGGVPRSKISLLLASRVFKTYGEKRIPSADFTNSGVGKVLQKSFHEVTANTFRYLLEETSGIYDTVISNGGEVRYTAYGYHGTEILIDGNLQWQSYHPYQQGWAKIALENIAAEYHKKGVKASVYNCPEIRTNSSDIFIGVELSLFPLINSVKQYSSPGLYDKIINTCQAKLSEGVSVDDILQQVNTYLGSDILKEYRDFKAWPMENTNELANLMINTSESITKKHKDRKDLITDYLSKLILVESGKIIFNNTASQDKPAYWIGHDIIASNLESA